MELIIIFILGIVCFMALTIWRDTIKPLQLISGLVFIGLACFDFLEKPHFKIFAPGAQSSERWGAPVHNYAIALVALILGICFLIGATKK